MKEQSEAGTRERGGWERRLLGKVLSPFTHYERRILTLLLLVFVVDYGDRALVGSLGPTLERVFHINNTGLGILAAAFVIVGAGASLPLGALTDRIKRVWLFAVVLLIWAIAEGFVGAALFFAWFLIARLFLGAVAAITGPGMPSLVGDLVPAGDRGREFGYVTSGQLIGTGVGYILPVIILSFASWRWNFWVLGIAGALLGFAFFKQREPKRSAAGGPDNVRRDTRGHLQPVPTQGQAIVGQQGVEPNRLAVLTRDPGEMSIWDAALYVYHVRTDLIVMIASAIGEFFFQGVATFAVVFATGWYHLSQGTADLAILVLGIGAILGVLFVGRIADALLRRRRVNSRLWLGAIGFIIAPIAFFPAFLTHSLYIALPLFVVGAFFLAGAQPPLDAVRIDVVVPRLRGRTEAVRQIFRSIAEAAAPLAVGFVSVRIAGGGNHGLEITLILLTPVLLINGLVLLFALRTYQPDIAAAYASEKIEVRQEEQHEREAAHDGDLSGEHDTRDAGTQNGGNGSNGSNGGERRQGEREPRSDTAQRPR